ncbi:DnaJ domain-containing protein [Phenylobacterium sp.]|uniref:J domain-containing protein n=1 Tax=Phenylobacterium sp. TaxID=1871053 RepID=UPI002731123B|nr:DnaJ domain-containing protein [Phenylobacterium sp.]MDP1597928.1 DnaJ domain-containing protein [Phenylobacterium sp.]MDP3590734.1 DnaJ domain-containing protein [Phenylobacterium sp.]
MTYLAIGCAILVLLLWASRGKPVLKRREWRFLAGAFAVACFAAAAYVGIRGGWGKSIVLVVIGLGLVVSTRRTGIAPPAGSNKIGDAEARSILGVGAEASHEEIRAAYSRLMRMAHPDKGGTSGLAAQLNAARDRLLKK